MGLSHVAAKATEAAPPEATEAATAAPRRIAGTPTRYEPPLTFLLPASHVAIWWTGTGVWQRRVRWRCNHRASRARGGLPACRRHAERPQDRGVAGLVVRRPSRDHRGPSRS